MDDDLCGALESTGKPMSFSTAISQQFNQYLKDNRIAYTEEVCVITI